MTEYTLIFLKPSAIKRGLIGEILSRFEKKGFEIVDIRMLTMTREMAQEFYSVHKGKPFFETLINTISGERIVAAILKGREAINVVRKLVGATDPSNAEAVTIRGDWGLDITDNIIHASDSKESFEKEVKILFPDFE
jgi:nucleoside-diphosphate kinase